MRWRAGASQVITTAVVGIAILGGQWTLWWHIQHDHEHSRAEDPPVGSAGQAAVRDSVTLELGDLDAGSLTLPEQFEPRFDFDAANSGVQYFPESIENRLSENAVARTGVAVLKADGRLQTIAAPDSTALTGGVEDAPETLNPPADAAPIESNDSSLNALIQKELPDATPEEMQIWAEELQGLPPQAVREILQLRKKLGRSRPLVPSWIAEPPGLARLNDAPVANTSEPEGIAVLGNPTASRIEPTLSAFKLARDVFVNNLANAQTVAFKRSLVLFEDLSYEKLSVSDPSATASRAAVSIGLGVRIAGTSIEYTPAALFETGQPLNVGIKGRGFLQVTDGNVTYYTRAGTLTIDADSRLAFASADRVLPLVPAITIPEGVLGLEIRGDGTVTARKLGEKESEILGAIELCRFVNPPALERVGGNLFLATTASGPPVPGKPETESRGSLEQGYLEQSNVDIAKEEAILKIVDRHIQSMIRAAESSFPPPAGVPLREAAHR